MAVGNTRLRFISQLHELASHPRYLSVLVKQTNPREGSVPENVIRMVHGKLHDEMGAAISERACQDLVTLALKLGLLEKDMHWAARGHVINYASPPLDVMGTTIRETSQNLKKSKRPFRHATLPLGEKESVIFLKYYLDADGAFLITFLKELGSGIDLSEFLDSKGLESIFLQVVELYLSRVFDIRPRLRLRKLTRYAERGYSRHVRSHKLVPRLEVLTDLHILEKKITADRAIRYEPMDPVLRIFLDQFSDPLTLNIALKKDYFERASTLYGLNTRGKASSDLLINAILKSYEIVRDETFRLAHLDAIRDITCLDLLFSDNKLCEWEDVNRAIEDLHQKSERDIRYHVNDMGVISYITITNDFIRKMS